MIKNDKLKQNMTSPDRIETGTVPPEYLHLEDPISYISADFLRVKQQGTIRIWTSEVHPQIFNHPLIMESLRHAKIDKGVNIIVRAGPVILVDEQGENGILQLSKEGVITSMHHLSDPSIIGEFYIVEGQDKNFSLQEFVRYHLKAPYTELVNNPRREADWQQQRSAQIQANFFDKIISLISSREEARCRQPHLITETGLQQLIEQVEKSGQTYDFLGIDQLLELSETGQLLTPYTKSPELPTS